MHTETNFFKSFKGMNDHTVKFQKSTKEELDKSIKMHEDRLQSLKKHEESLDNSDTDKEHNTYCSRLDEIRQNIRQNIRTLEDQKEKTVGAIKKMEDRIEKSKDSKFGFRKIWNSLRNLITHLRTMFSNAFRLRAILPNLTEDSANASLVL